MKSKTRLLNYFIIGFIFLTAGCKMPWDSNNNSTTQIVTNSSATETTNQHDTSSSADTTNSDDTTHFQDTTTTGQIIDFIEVKGYFCTEESSPIKFFIIKDQNIFDSTFSGKPPPYDRSQITKIDLSNNFVAAIVKEGNNYWEMKVNKILLKDKTLKIYYIANNVRPNMSWIACIPLIIMIKNTYYDKIEFFENNVLIKEL